MKKLGNYFLGTTEAFSSFFISGSFEEGSLLCTHPLKLEEKMSRAARIASTNPIQDEVTPVRRPAPATNGFIDAFESAGKVLAGEASIVFTENETLVEYSGFMR